MPHKGHAHSIDSIVPSARSRYAGQRSEAQEKLRPSAPSIRMTTGSPTRSYGRTCLAKGAPCSSVVSCCRRGGRPAVRSAAAS